MTDLLTLGQAAAVLGISRPTVRAWQNRGLLERVDVAGQRLVPARSVGRYIEERTLRRAGTAILIARVQSLETED